MRRSGHHVMLAVPTRGSVRWETITRLEEIRDATPGLGPIVYQPGNLSVAMARNRIVKRFLEDDGLMTLVMVDDDVVPPPHALERLDPLIPEYGMASIPHPHPWQSDPGRVVLSAYDVADGGYTPARLVDGVNEVDAVATGCVAVSRAALEATGPHPFRVSHDPDAAVSSDDFLFCADLRILGFKVGAWADGWFCDHITTVGLGPIWETSTQGVPR